MQTLEKTKEVRKIKQILLMEIIAPQDDILI